MFREFEWYMGKYIPKQTEEQKLKNRQLIPSAELRKRYEQYQPDSDEEYNKSKDAPLSVGTEVIYERTH